MGRRTPRVSFQLSASVNLLWPDAKSYDALSVY